MKSKGEKVNWDEKANEGAIKHYSDWCPDGTLEAHRRGARWQREQLRTPEAIERVARAMATLEPGEEWPSNEQLGGGPAGDRDTELKDAYMGHARTMIAALLGGSDSD